MQPPQVHREPVIDPPSQEYYDFFISHASEDKEGFVRQLEEVLQSKGASVWYDEFTLKVGDSLRREIDRGLVNSRFGVVVLSEAFFKKEWPQKESELPRPSPSPAIPSGASWNGAMWGERYPVP